MVFTQRGRLSIYDRLPFAAPVPYSRNDRNPAKYSAIQTLPHYRTQQHQTGSTMLKCDLSVSPWITLSPGTVDSGTPAHTWRQSSPLNASQVYHTGYTLDHLSGTLSSGPLHDSTERNSETGPQPHNHQFQATKTSGAHPFSLWRWPRGYHQTRRAPGIHHTWLKKGRDCTQEIEINNEEKRIQSEQWNDKKLKSRGVWIELESHDKKAI